MNLRGKGISVVLILLALCKRCPSKGLCDFDRMFPNLGTERCSSGRRLPPVYLNWTDWGNSSYAFSRTLATWEDAVKICQDYDAHLIFITSEEELNFALNSINASHSYYSWIRVTHRDQNGDSWQLGSGSASYENFEEDYGSGEQCPEIRALSWQKGLYFYPCNDGNPFTCEREYRP